MYLRNQESGDARVETHNKAAPYNVVSQG